MRDRDRLTPLVEEVIRIVEEAVRSSWEGVFTHTLSPYLEHELGRVAPWNGGELFERHPLALDTAHADGDGPALAHTGHSARACLHGNPPH